MWLVIQIWCLCLLLTRAANTSVLDMGIYRNLIVNVHNNIRRREGAANMKYMLWDDDLAQNATEWVKHCNFRHQQSSFGENLAHDARDSDKVGERKIIARMLSSWHDERRDHQWTRQSCRGSCHFTQMIWWSTNRIGCGAAVCENLTIYGNHQINNALFLVCNYAPRGNWMGQYPYLEGNTCSMCAEGERCKNRLCHSVTSLQQKHGLMADASVSDSVRKHTPTPRSGKVSQPTWISSCQDARPRHCQVWKAQGECDRNKEIMEFYCKLTCNVCQPDKNQKDSPLLDENELKQALMQKVWDECIDRYDEEQCQIWTTLGECEMNPIAMEYHCTRSCGLCHKRRYAQKTDLFVADQRTGEHDYHQRQATVHECKDVFSRKKCKEVYRLGMCKKPLLKKWMVRNCQRSCKLCRHGRFATSISGRQCRDMKSRKKCMRFKSLGFCTSKRRKMETACPRLCGFCSGN